MFTDLDIAREALYLERLFGRLRGAVTAYRQLFLPFALDEKWEGLDVVIIEKHEDYALETGAPDTVGLFLPARRASYYSFARFGTADAPGAVRVLFHEVCHQLDYKLLRMIHPSPWLQEGLALYFEGLRPGPHGGYVLAGLPSDSWHYLRRAGYTGGQRWLGLERLVGTRDLQSLRGTPQVHDFYVQAGALVHLLLGDLPAHPAIPERRALFYRLVAALKEERTRPEKAAADFRQLLAEAGWTPEEFERILVNALIPMSE